jgi:predicted PurR-regulated permease PerM
MIERKNAATLLLLGAAAVALYFCYLLFRPYATSILFACVIAIVFHPIHAWIRRIFPGQNVSASISTALTLLIGIVPLGFLLVAVSNELAGLYLSLSSRNGGPSGLISSWPQWLEAAGAWVQSHLALPQINLHEILLRRLEGLSSSLARLGATFLANAFSFIVNALICIVILFFLFRDGDCAVSRIIATLPFRSDQLEKLRSRISSTVIANFYGGVAVGALQGTLTGLTFWALGLQSPVLWGVVTGFFSLVPMVGSATVWVPAAIVLLLSGHFLKAVVLLAIGAGIIGTIDNIVRPLIVQKSIHLHTLFVFFALLGGLRLFGVLGLFVGPVILSVTAALLVMLQEDLAGRTVPESVDEISEGKRDSLLADSATR